MENCTENKACLCCGSPQLKKFFDMGDRPPCNRLVALGEREPPSFPLALNVCEDCFHQQLTHSVDADLMFSRYPYRTGFSTSHQRHFRELAGWCENLFEGDNKSYCVVGDIGSNDGTLLSFMPATYQRHAIDPFVKPDLPGRYDVYHDAAWHKPDIDLGVKYDLLTATNVLAHNPNPKVFVANVVKHLREGGYFVIETPCSLDLLKNTRFDTIYHEHISYYNLSSLVALLQDFPLEITSITYDDTHHGRTIRLAAKKVSGEVGMADRIRKTIRYDADLIIQLHLYETFQRRVSAMQTRMETIIEKAKAAGDHIIGFGASAKGVTLVNYFTIKPEFIIDETPEKHYKYTPQSHIPIRPLLRGDAVTQNRSLPGVLCLIFTWNCLQESLEKLNTMYPEGSTRRSYFWYGMKEPLPF